MAKKKETKKKEEPRYYSKCGIQLVLVSAPNEKDFYTMSLYSIYPLNRAGEKYDRKTGKRMHRTEWHCPAKTKGGWFSKKEYHDIILGETDLID